MGDDGDQLAAIGSDGSVRGIATDIGSTLDFGPYAFSPLWEMTIRSNNNGDAISFQYYDASEDVVLEASTTYTFVTNEQLGDVFNPYEITISSTVDLSIELIAGFNWISYNVDAEDASLGSLLSSVADEAIFIASQSSGTATNYGAYGWYGSLESLDNTEMYLLEMAAPATLTITGFPVDVASTPISLIPGFNWVGYLPQNPGDLGTALATVSDAAIFMASQSSGTATNYGDYGWYGSLATLEPGNGYLLEMGSAGTLVYPEFDGLARLSDNKEAITLPNKISDWDFNYADYRYTGSVTASIENREDSDGDIVGVFVGDECRGIAERMYFPFDDSYMYIVQVYSHVVEGDEMTFKYYDVSTDEVITYDESITFIENMHMGDGFNTFALVDEVDGMQVAPLGYALNEAYPNPFNPVTSISYTLENNSFVEISVYDINGRVIAELINGYNEAGTHAVEWNAGDLSSGVYMIHMNVDNFSAIQKVMLIK